MQNEARSVTLSSTSRLYSTVVQGRQWQAGAWLRYSGSDSSALSSVEGIVSLSPYLKVTDVAALNR